MDGEGDRPLPTRDNEWPIVELQRGTRTVWTAYEDGKAVRYDPAPDLHLTQGRVVWRGRAYTEAETGTATIARVTGDVDTAPGDHLSYHTLTSSEDPAHWISVESWDSSHVEISIGQTWSVNRIGRRT